MPTMTRSNITLRERLADKLPEIVIEAASVVFALLFALGLNRWNENREIAARADAVRTAIRSELAENRTEIETARPQLAAIRQHLRDVIDGKDPAQHELSINLGVSLLSAAAWHAALATQASQTIDFKWMTTVAKIYELQDNYLRVQGDTVDRLISIPADKNLGGKQVAESLIARIDGLAQLADGLADSYVDVIGPAPAH
jgi:hypothetical protein